MPVPLLSPIPTCNNQKCLQTLLNVPWGTYGGTKCPLAENQCSWREGHSSEQGKQSLYFATKELINSPQMLYFSKKSNNIKVPLQHYYPIASDVFVFLI